mgnify:CR=1 FL=1
MTLSPRNHKIVRAVVDYGGLAAWLIAYFAGGRNLVNATWALVAGSALALVIGFVVERRVAPFPLIAGAAGLIFGSLTLVFHDARFLKVKPTVMNLLFGIGLLGGLALRRNPLKFLLGDAFPMADEGWRRLTVRYGLFFLALAALNEAIWRTQPDAVWVLFRFPGLMVLTVAFAVTQAPLMMKYAHTDHLPEPPVE